MLTRENYSREHITALQMNSRNDPALLERVLYAFGLLEAITKVELPFIFKGGTCLMLLLKRPMRLSTDIDIIVEPGTDIDEYIEKAGRVFPFLRVEENKRVGKNKIEKRHFKFTYLSPTSGKEVTILLDVLFEGNHYSSMVDRNIENELLLVEKPDITVKIPNINCILGRGSILSEDYKHYQKGLSGIKGHIYKTKYNGEYAALYACEVMYLAASVLTNQKECSLITEPEKYIDSKLALKEYQKLSYMKKAKLEAYGYIVESVKLLENRK